MPGWGIALIAYLFILAMCGLSQVPRLLFDRAHVPEGDKTAPPDDRPVV